MMIPVDSDQPDPEANANDQPASKVLLLGNLRTENFNGPDGAVVSGTKHFSGGTKVFFRDAHWGMGAETIDVVGRHRGSARLIAINIQRRKVHNWRTKVIYSPAVLRHFEGRFRTFSRQQLDEMALRWNADRWGYVFHRSAIERNRVVARWLSDGVNVPDHFTHSTSEFGMIAYGHGPDDPIGICHQTVDGVASWVLAGAEDVIWSGTENKLRSRLQTLIDDR